MPSDFEYNGHTFTFEAVEAEAGAHGPALSIWTERQLIKLGALIEYDTYEEAEEAYARACDPETADDRLTLMEELDEMVNFFLSEE